MNVQIAVRRMSVSQSLRQLIRQLCIEVRNKYRSIQNIDVVIEDINGPYKAGIDKRCHLRVRGKERMVIDVDECDSDLRHVIDQAFCRLYHLLNRRWAFRMNRLKSSAVDPCLLIKGRGGKS